MKYYKIFNKEETHNGLKYKYGINKDILRFKPYGDCLCGGMYYASEDILAFLDYGPYIREVKLLPDSKVYENPGSPKKWKTDKFWLGKKRKITLAVIKELEEEGADIHVDGEEVLTWASENGHLETVKYLVSKGANIHAAEDYALRYAAENGHLKVVKYLVSKGANIHARNGFALSWASAGGQLKVVKYLVSKGAHLRARKGLAVMYATARGHLEVAKYLSSLEEFRP